MGRGVGALCQFSWKDQRELEKQKHGQLCPRVPPSSTAPISGNLSQGLCWNLQCDFVQLLKNSPCAWAGTRGVWALHLCCPCVPWLLWAEPPVSVISPLMEKSTCPAFLHSTPLRLGSCCLRRCSKTVPSVHAEATQKNTQRVARSHWAEVLLQCGHY